MKSHLSYGLLFVCSLLHAQPNTEVYLFDLSLDGDPQVSNPINVSNNPGYDNQPSFWSDSQSLLYSRTVANQTEIARYFIDSKKTEVITNTKQGSEYSPTRMPDGRISSIRLDTTGLQLLYAYDFDGKDEVIVPDLKIGYHAWINEDFLAAFVLGDPATMQVIEVASGEAKIVSEDIGRSLHRIPKSRDISFVDKSKETWDIYAISNDGDRVFLTKTLAGSEDYCWTPNQQIIMAKGSELYYWKENRDWKAFVDLNTYEMNEITRLAVSPDGSKLAVVVSE